MTADEYIRALIELNARWEREQTPEDPNQQNSGDDCCDDE
jgi:hypothetical protein